MKKAIKKITLFSLMISIVFIGKFWFSNKETSVSKSSSSSGSAYVGSEQSDGSSSNPFIASTSFNEYTNLSLSSQESSINNSNNPSVQSTTITSSNQEIVDNNIATISQESNTADVATFNSEYKTNDLKVPNTIGSNFSTNSFESSSTTNNEITAELAQTNSTTAARNSSAETNTTASRISPNNNAISGSSFSPPPVIETPGDPGGGEDPFAPIDDYYALLAIMLCGGFIAYKRFKEKRLVFKKVLV